MTANNIVLLNILALKKKNSIYYYVQDRQLAHEKEKKNIYSWTLRTHILLFYILYYLSINQYKYKCLVFITLDFRDFIYLL